jgi:hypothetical protein
VNTATSTACATLCRWIARPVGTLLVLVIICIAIGQGLPNPLTQPPKVEVGFLALALMVSGILAGWRWELAGGLIALFGWSLFLVPVMASPRGMAGFDFALAAPGLLYVTSALLRRSRQSPLPLTPSAGLD